MSGGNQVHLLSQRLREPDRNVRQGSRSPTQSISDPRARVRVLACSAKRRALETTGCGSTLAPVSTPPPLAQTAPPDAHTPPNILPALAAATPRSSPRSSSFVRSTSVFTKNPINGSSSRLPRPATGVPTTTSLSPLNRHSNTCHAASSVMNSVAPSLLPNSRNCCVNSPPHAHRSTAPRRRDSPRRTCASGNFSTGNSPRNCSRQYPNSFSSRSPCQPSPLPHRIVRVAHFQLPQLATAPHHCKPRTTPPTPAPTALSTTHRLRCGATSPATGALSQTTASARPATVAHASGQTAFLLLRSPAFRASASLSASGG